jgi:putative methionine-R-sulfoxide reductase with GAF domain
MELRGARPSDINRENSIFGRDRRRVARHKVYTPAYASLMGSSHSAALELCEVLNISENGMCIQASAPMKPNRLLPLVLDLSETQTRIHTTGHVVWSDSSGKTGIRFPEMPEASRLQLQQWLVANDVASAMATNYSLVSDFKLQNPSSRPHAASSYTSLVNEWSDIEKEVDLFGPELDPALQVVAQRALTLTWASGAAIALMNKLKPSELICRARAGTDSPELGARLQAGAGFSGECVRSATTLKCDDAQTDSRVDRESCRALGIRSLIACPVKRKTGEVIGILEVFSPEIAAFWDNDSNILERLTRIIAKAVSRAEHSRPDVLAVAPPSDEQETNLLATTLRAFQDQEFAARIPSFSRRVALFLVGASALVIAIWLSKPWIKDGIARFISHSVAPSAEASPERDRYVGTNTKELTKFAIKGDRAAQYALGMRYGTGDGVKQNYSEAMAWFRQAAEQGEVRAQAKLAMWYWAGRGAAKDCSKSYYWGLLAQAGGEQSVQQMVMECASTLSDAQRAAEHREADKWLHAHHIGSETPD